MALERRTIVDQITVCRDFSVNVRLLKQIADGEKILVAIPHRFIVEPHDDFYEILNVVNLSLMNEGWGEIQDVERQRIERILAD